MSSVLGTAAFNGLSEFELDATSGNRTQSARISDKESVDDEKDLALCLDYPLKK